MHTRGIIIRVCLFSIFIATLIFGCKKENEPISSNDELSIPETTKVIDQNNWSNYFIDLDSSNFTYAFKSDFTNNLAVSVGDIIVSKDGYGHLRKVTDIKFEEDVIKLYTSSISLSEAIENGGFSFSSTLSEQKIMSIEYKKEGIKLDTSNYKSTEETALSYEIDTYLDNDQKVHLAGSFEILPSLNAELIIKGFNVNKLNVEFEVEEQINIETTLELLDIQFQEEVELAKVTFQPIVAMIGTVPVIIVPELEIMAGVDIEIHSEVSATVNQSINYVAGLLYEEDEWSTFKLLNKQLNYSPPSLSASAEAKAYIKPQLNVKFYGTVAPYLSGELYGRIEADIQVTPWWTLYGGINVGVGVMMEIFGKELFNYYTNPPILEYEIFIIDAVSIGANQSPEMPSSPYPINNSIFQPLNIDLSWECSDPEYNPMTYDIYFGTSQNPELIESDCPNKFFNPGNLELNTQYYWKIIAKDDHENITEGPLWNFQTTDGIANHPPNIPEILSPSDGSSDISIDLLLQWQCSDPDNDPLTFDVYFGTTNPPPIAETSINVDQFDPGTLSNSTQYYWQINAMDDYENITEGEIWTFQTEISFSSATIVDIYEAPDGTQPSGLTIGNGYLWMSSYIVNHGLYQIDLNSCSLIDHFTLNNIASWNGYSGLAFDGIHLWHSDFYGTEGISELLVPPTSAIKSFNTPDNYISELAFDGVYLWSTGFIDDTDSYEYNLRKFDIANNQLISTFPIALTQAHCGQSYGLTFDGDNLWISRGNVIAKLTQTGNIISAVSINGASRLECLAWDGTYLWAASFDQAKIYKIFVN